MYVRKSSIPSRLVEALETRALLSGNPADDSSAALRFGNDGPNNDASAITVNATAAADAIAVALSDDGASVVVTLNGTVVSTTAVEDVTRMAINAAAGDDTVVGGAGDDTLHGGAGDDLVGGNLGDDRVHGNDGDDLVFGTTGDDTLTGGAGDDRLAGGADDDVVTGGTGTDTFYYRYEGTAGLDGADVYGDLTTADVLLFDDGSDGTIAGGANPDAVPVDATDALPVDVSTLTLRRRAVATTLTFADGGTIRLANFRAPASLDSVSDLQAAGYTVRTV